MMILTRLRVFPTLWCVCAARLNQWMSCLTWFGFFLTQKKKKSKQTQNASLKAAPELVYEQTETTSSVGSLCGCFDSIAEFRCDQTNHTKAENQPDEGVKMPRESTALLAAL